MATRTPIRRLLVRESLAVGVLALGLLLFLAWWTSFRLLRTQATAQAEQGLESIEARLQRHLSSAERLGDALALMWKRGEVGPELPGTELTLEGLIQSSEVQALILTDTQGRMASANAFANGYRTRAGQHMRETQWNFSGEPLSSRLLEAPPLDLTQRPWYQQAMREKGPSWTAPYIFLNPPVPGVTYAQQARDASGRLLGAVGIDLRLEEMNQLMRQVKPTAHALAFLVDAQGRALALPDTPEFQDPAARQAAYLKPLEGGSLQVGRAALELPAGELENEWPSTKVGGQSWLLHRHHLARPGWDLLIAIPEKDLLAQPRSRALQMLAVGLAALLAITLRLMQLSRHIARPLVDLAASSQALLAGEPIPAPKTDIEEIDQAGRALEAATSTLLERRRLEAQLQRAQRLELLGTLAAGLAHDMNNHLAAVSAQLELAQLKSPEGPHATYVERAREAIKGCASMTQALLTFGRPRKPKVELVHLNALIRQAASLLEHSRGKTVRLELELDEADPTVFGDAVQLEQVLLNLGFNAKDAMEAGGKLGFRSSSVDGEARISVSDTGTGMSAETREKLFTPFFTTKEEGKGTGLGLAMVFGIVKAHGGRIEVESEPGVGTTFTLWLPSGPGRGLSGQFQILD